MDSYYLCLTQTIVMITSFSHYKGVINTLNDYLFFSLQRCNLHIKELCIMKN